MINNNEFAFLLGSGTSITVGLPDIYKITNNMYPLLDVYKESNGRFYKEIPNNTDVFSERLQYNNPISITIAFCIFKLRSYYSYLEYYQVNYEDIYYLISQIHDDLLREWENPAIVNFKKELEENLNYFINEEITYLDILANTLTYIENVVCYSLTNSIKDLKNLSFILNACLDSEYKTTHIFTLNHDKVIEKLFTKNKIKYTDGFGNSERSLRYWNPTEFDKDYRVGFYKLHGSVNWFRFSTDNGKNYRIGNTGNLKDIDHTKNIDDELQDVFGPELLVGTSNKILNYPRALYSEMFFRLHLVLKRVNVLIIIGYGFKDKAINSKIIEYMNYSINNKLIIIDKKPIEDLTKMARTAIKRESQLWIKNKQLHYFSESIKDFKWDKIKKLL